MSRRRCARGGRFEHAVARGQGQAAAVGHGVARVDRQVEQGEVELQRVDRHRPQVVRALQFELDALAQHVADQLHGIAQLLARGHRQQPGVLDPAEGAELAGEGGGADDGALAGVDQALHLGLGRGQRRQLQRRGQGLQQVVEFVGDAAGEAAQGFQLLAAHHGRLRAFAGVDGFLHALFQLGLRARIWRLASAMRRATASISTICCGTYATSRPWPRSSALRPRYSMGPMARLPKRRASSTASTSSAAMMPARKAAACSGTRCSSLAEC
jgi:hypothetical protein